MRRLTTILLAATMLTVATPVLGVQQHEAPEDETDEDEQRSHDRYVLRLTTQPSEQLTDRLEAIGLTVELVHEGALPFVAVSGSGEQIQQASREDEVRAVEPDRSVELASNPTNDPYSGTQWGLFVTGFPAAHQALEDKVSFGTPDGVPGACEHPGEDGVLPGQAAFERAREDPCVVVAVIDTGVDLGHPDLSGRAWMAQHDVTDDPSWMPDPFGHGTHVAGIVAAHTDNGEGIASPAGTQQVFIDSIKVFSSEAPTTPASVVAAGILDAVDRGADILQMSLGSNYPSQLKQDAIEYARDRGVLPIVAAMNEYGDEVGYAAAYPGVVAVTAADAHDSIATFSSAGPGADIAAPGNEIPSTIPSYPGYAYQAYYEDDYDWYHYIQGDELYGTLSGTSMATPYVSGVAALTYQLLLDPECRDACAWWADGALHERVPLLLEATAEDQGTPGWDPAWGWGLVQVDAVVAALEADLPPQAPSITSVGEPTVDREPEHTNAGRRDHVRTGPGGLQVYTAHRYTNTGFVEGDPVDAVEISVRIHPLTAAEMSTGTNGAIAGTALLRGAIQKAEYYDHDPGPWTRACGEGRAQLFSDVVGPGSASTTGGCVTLSDEHVDGWLFSAGLLPDTRGDQATPVPPRAGAGFARSHTNACTGLLAVAGPAEEGLVLGEQTGCPSVPDGGLVEDGLTQLQDPLGGAIALLYEEVRGPVREQVDEQTGSAIDQL